MESRDFSDSIKLHVIAENMRINDGNIKCSICGKKLSAISECHFDHIIAFAKGGKSTTDNCQILCIDCNLKKQDKELQDFLLEEKAKRFFAGENLSTLNQNKIVDVVVEEEKKQKKKISKDEFDHSISDFIARKGDIHKVDFSRDYNHLPSIWYVKEYYGDLTTLKKAFGIEDLSASWNRETIKKALVEYVKKNGDVFEKDLKKRNKLPSLPCILNYYPEYENLTNIKKNMLGLSVRHSWDMESVIQAGKEYLKTHDRITEESLNSQNNLPTSRVIYEYFGSLTAYQKIVGSEISFKNEYVSEKDIEEAVNQYFGGEGRVIDSMKKFFESFKYSPSTINKRFGSLATFCEKYNITVKYTKKASYTKQEVDDAVAKWVRKGKEIPAAKELKKEGLPSVSVIRKYYEDWKEPFVLYKKMYDKLNG